MTANGKRDEDGSFATPRNFLHSFWAVFTLPFRTVRFIFRRLGDIPVKNLILMSAIFIILIGVTLVAVIKATSQPGFCVSCHYMRPYFASWEESTHNDVHCTECHFPPGIRGTVEGKFTAIAMVANYFTGVYKKSKPWAEISDKSCLRSGCHETRVLSGQVPFKEGIVFDHEPHLTEDRRGKNLRCTSCHSQIVQGSHMKVTEESCFLCHFKDQEPDSPMNACTYCHDAPTTADSANVVFDHTDIIDREADCKLCHGSMVQGEGDVQKERCSYCHADAGKLEKFSETVELHNIHITDHKVECNHCHSTILHQSVARTGKIKPDCQECHSNRHNEQYLLFSGQGSIESDPMPSSMFHAGLSCRACHLGVDYEGDKSHVHMTKFAGAISCEPCHDQSYYRLYEDAKPILNRQIKSTKDRIIRLERTKYSSSAAAVLSDVRKDIELVENGQPIHNLNFSKMILDEINRELDRLEGKTPKPRTLPDTTSAKCLKCHYGQDEIVVNHNNKTFSHRNHVHAQQTGCTTCHEEAKPNHGMIREGSYCMDCHHSKALVSCEPCHSHQRDLYKATGPFEGMDADIMFEAELVCRDCHEVTGTHVSHPGDDNCETCHEAGYRNDYREMQTEIRNELVVLEEKYKALSKSSGRESGLKTIKALQMDGSNGAHNMILAMDLLDKLKSDLKKLE
ncbi:MAG: NapC/NirT family cytochrome c [Deltaproteobacteria bacterium]|nr:NapC/NirT family cytochrome c [Deltaproteobacteria bacterium]